MAELEWRHRGLVVAGAGGIELEQAGDAETVPKQGFETAVSAPTGMGTFEVQALDSGGNVLSTSPAATVGPHIGIAGRTAFVSGSGTGGLPAVCDNGFACHIAVTITAGRTVVARTGTEKIPGNGGGIIYFSLTGAGRSLLAHARGNRLLVRLNGNSGKLSLNRLITLVRFSTSGAAPAHSASQSGSLRVLGGTNSCPRMAWAGSSPSAWRRRRARARPSRSAGP